MCEFPKNEFNILYNFGPTSGSISYDNTIKDAFDRQNANTVYRG